MTDRTNAIVIGLLVLFIIGWTTVQSSAQDSIRPTAKDRSGTQLERKLTGRNESIRDQTLAGLESNRSSLRDSLSQVVNAAVEISKNANKDELIQPSVVRLIHLVGSVDSELAEQGLVELLDSPHPGIAMVAAETLGKNKFHGAIDFLKKQTSRPEYQASYAFRFNLIRALVLMEHPDAIEFISDQSRSLDGQLKYKIDGILADITVDHFQGDETRYQQWLLSREQDKSIFKQASHEPESLTRIRLTKNQYYGIDIRAKRLMFIIDRSGSMRAYDGGLSRLDRAKAELIRAIDELPADTEFALLFFDTDVGLWRDRLVIATEENKREAISHVRRLRDGSKTNTHGALRKALEFDENLEAVFLLTDGRPTTGDLVHPNAIIDDVLHRNRFRHLNFSTIGIAVEDSTELFLKTLAEETGGEYRAAK